MTESRRDPVRAARDEFEGAGIPTSSKPTPGEQPGDRIDRYKLLQEIGEGGMGTVWMAEQKEPVKRQVALKIIKLGMDTKEVVVRFEAERQALALMDHPNIARVLDGGATDSGRPFFVMELVRGVPITQFCDEAALGIRERLELFAKVCDAVQHAHHKGVIHRDLKPSNVMVTLNDGVPMPKVIDFGIAKATSAELTQKTMFTEYGSMIGTPEYMAPEQAEMSALDVDTRADIYSLGVLLYELLTGTKPFNVTDVLQHGYQELLRTIREESPAKPSTRVSTLNEGAASVARKRELNAPLLSARLRGDIDWMVMKALEKDRGRRYGTATEFAADVHRYLAGEAVLAAPPSRSYRLRKFLARRRKSVAALAAITLLFIAGAVGTGIGWWNAHHAKRALEVANGEKDEALRSEQSMRRAAQAAEAEARAQAGRFVAIITFNEERMANMNAHALGVDLHDLLVETVGDEGTDELERVLEGVNFADVGIQAMERNLIEPMVLAIRARFRDEPSAQARLLNGASAALGAMRRHEKSLELSREALTLLEEEGLDDAGLAATIRASIAIQLGALGRWTDSAAAARDVLEAAEQAVIDERCLGQAYYAMGLAEYGLGRPESAIEHQRQALAIALQYEDPLSQSVFHRRIGLVLALMQAAAWEESEQLAREALSIYRARYEPQHPWIVTMRIAIASIELQRGDAGVEASNLESLVRDASTAFGAASQEMVDATIILAGTLSSQGRQQEAKQALTEALARLDAAKDSREKQPDRDRLSFFLYQVEGALGERASSETQSARDLEQARADGLSGLPLASALVARARVLKQRGDVPEAEGLFLEAQQECLDLEPNHPVRVTIRLELAILLRLQNRVEEAIPALRAAVSDCSDAMGDDHSMTLSARNSLAVALQGTQEFEEAEGLLRQVLETYQARFGESHPTTLFFATNHAGALLSLGRPQEALDALRASRAGLTEALGRDHRNTIYCSVHEGAALLDLARFDEALSVLGDAVPALERTLGEREPMLRYALQLAGQAHLASGDVDAGEALLGRSLELTETYAADITPSVLYGLARQMMRRGLHGFAVSRWEKLIELRTAEWDGDERHLNVLARLAVCRGLQDAHAEYAPELETHLLALWRDGEDQGPRATRLRQELLELADTYYGAWQGRDADSGAMQKLADLKARLEEIREDGSSESAEARR